MKQTCQQCKWYYYKLDAVEAGFGEVPQPVHLHACYYNGKWTKWLKKDSVDKPNNCDKFDI